MKKLYLLLILLFFAMHHIAAQTTETFETATVDASSFTNGTKTFNLSSSYLSFKVFNLPGQGYNGSNNFLQVEDSSGSAALGQTGTFTDVTGSFKLSSLWIYVTGSAAFTAGVTSNGLAGDITFRGKLGGVTQFTVVKTTTGASIPLTLPGNGFLFINFATEGGSNNTTTIIDQLEIQLSNNYDYFAVDNFIFSNGAVAPTVSTTTATGTGSVKATMGGNVTADGGDATIERGIVWGTAVNPTTANNKFQIGTGTGIYSGIVSSFPPSTLIHYRAYAKNSGGTAYGNDLTFTTTAALNTSSTPSSNVSCNGGNNGVGAATVTGGSGGYTYSWAPSGGNGSIATGLAANTYTLTITDSEGTIITRTYNITQPTAISLVTGSSSNVSCNGGNNGVASVTPTGGTPGYSYSWAPSGGTGSTASGLAAGTYTVTVTDANTCQATRTFNIGQPAAALSLATGSSSDVSCNGGSNGVASVTPTGGTPGYTYSWAPSGGTGSTAAGLAAGTYTVTVTDNNTCQATRTFVINQPAAPLSLATGSSSDISCNGGANGVASVSPTGGTFPYTYSWAPSGGTGSTAAGLTAGTYTVTVTDNNTCQSTRTYVINEPAAPISLATGSSSDVSCNGGANGVASVSPTGGTFPYTYSWAPSGGTGSTAAGLTAGTYTVTVTDNNTCQSTRTFVIGEPAAPLSLATGSSSDVSCNGGANGIASVTPTGGTFPYAFSWAPSGGTGSTATGLAAGTYTVTVTDNNTCQTTRTFVIGEPATALVASDGGQTNVSCNLGANGSATVNATGGTPTYTYSWAPAGGTAATATGLTAGTYTATVTDANGCTATQSFTITEPTAIIASAAAQTNVNCNGGSNGSAAVTATGGTGSYTYSWAPSGGTAATAAGLTAGTYTATVTDANGCTGTQSFTITEPTAIIASAAAQNNVSCNGGANGTATVSATGGTGAYTYSWAPTGGTADTAAGLTAGTYTATVTDANGCTGTQSFTITEPAALVASDGGQTNVSCNSGANGTATVSVTGGTGSYTYSWAPAGGTAATASGLTAGSYTVTVTDANTCSTTQSFTITEPASLVASDGGQTNVSCNSGANGSATVSATGGTGTYTYSWAPTGGTAATATGLTAGTYTAIVTDANGCAATQSFTITEPTAIVAAPVAQTNIACNGGATGSATVTATGGTGTYTYSWTPSGGTAATASGLTAGTYTATVTDANGCSATQSFTLTEPTAIVATLAAQTNVSCNGGANGSATVSATGGTGSYTYSWSPSGGTAATAAGLTAGTYTATVTDANGCTATQSFTLTQPAPLVASDGGQTNVSCNSGSNGSATVSVTGGTGSYTYTWAPTGGTAATATGLTAGTYTVTVEDGNGCTTTQSFTITEPTLLVASDGGQTNVSCNSGANGSATVSATGGTGTYTYSWVPSGGTAATATGLTAGTYTAIVTDANGCTATQSFTITEPTAIVAAPVAQTNIACNGGATGSATVTATGGTGTYTYSWTPAGGTAATATGLTAGTYTATVTDANGCSATQSFTLTEPTAIIASAAAQNNVSCNGGANGTATVSATGGTGAYTYSWAPTGGTADTASGLTAGTYTATVTDANGCTGTQSFTITEPAALVASQGGQTNVSCNSGSNGSATVSVTGGTGSYTYTWAPTGGTADTASGLTAGTYTVTVTDANGCTTTQSFTITEPAVLVASDGGQTNVSCNSGSNGSATVNVTGGTTTYTYSWAPSGGTAATATGLTVGTYTVTVTDANGCAATQSFTITEPSALVASDGGQTNITCNSGSNGSATVTATGGTGTYTYSWAPAGGTAATASGLTAGTYTATVTDANGCSATQSFTITEPAALVASDGGQTNVSCNSGANGSATVNVVGGTGTYTYSWAPSGGTAATASGLAAGTYTVTVTDANACTATQSFTITEPAALVASAGAQDNVSCNSGSNGSATVSVTGGTGTYTYSWAPSGGTAATASGLTAGTYTVTVEDANGCTTTQSFTITEPTVLVASDGGQTNVSCNSGADGSATVNVTGGTTTYTYSWAPSGGTAATATGLTAGTYTVTVTDANGCATTQSFTITEPTALVASDGGQTNVTCNSGSNGSATVTATGGTGTYTYSWAPTGGTAATASGLTAGTYTATVTDANGCSATQSFTITEPAALVASDGGQTNVSCNSGSNGSATVNVVGGTGTYTYSWAPTGGTAATASGLTAGTYTATVTDANGCATTQSFTITEPAVLVASAAAQDNVSCNSGSNGSATVSVTGGTGTYTYSWAPSGGTAATASGLTAGTYTVIVEDANGCTTTQSFTITEPTVLVASDGGQTNVACNSGTDGSATLTATGGTGAYTYSWSPAGGTAATASGLTAGTYTATVTDANGCSATQSFTITEPTALVASIGSQTNVACNSGSDGSATVTATGGTGTYTYSWSPTGGTAATASGLIAGIYTATVTDANGCTATQSFTITQPTAIVATAAGQTDVTCNGAATGSATVSATGGTGAYTYSWAPTGGTADTASGLTAGTYTVTVTDANGCTGTQSFTITQPVALDAIVAQTNVTCIGGADGSATVTVSGGTSPYTYIWSPTGGTADTATGLTAGTYTVVITDSNGCTLTKTAVISTNPDTTAPVPDVTNLPDITNYCAITSSEIAIPTATDACAGTINATTTDPLNYTAVGTYVITWTYDDGHGNSSTQNQTLNVLASPIEGVTLSDVTATFDGSLHTIEVAGLPAGASVLYTISPITGSENGAIDAGTYLVTAFVSPAPGTNCSLITLNANLTINKAPQQITFGALPVKTLGAINDFTLGAFSDSGLPIRYSATFTSPLPPATVTAAGLVSMIRSGQILITAHQDGDSNYLPATSISQNLVIMNNNADLTKLTIGTTVYDNPAQQINYLMTCDEGNSLTISALNGSNATISPAATFTIPLPKPGIYNQVLTVTSEDASVVKNYTITVSKPFNFFDIARQKFNNVLLVNNNPQTNGGYEFVAYQWFKNGQLVGTGQYYSAGDNINNTLDPTADYMVKMTTKDGKVLQTCPTKIPVVNSLTAKVYPNPIQVGKVVTVEADYPEEELQNMQISLYTVTGQLVKTMKSSTVKTEIQLPLATESNMYIVVIETANVRKTLKVIVNK
ncbi:T9SS type A sorting domain-containing protein [Flavobacterium sp. Fl-318]|uniref:T9SS type A sorting domain-containing protein n=1 Tax=Flavobacterium cupriresistens TaxID=2893885 RepID=A0ABU4RGL1_9FLAO|nr:MULTISPECIES: T9SS type A sorting domain-containing protein [unclassified Flavobacterium]MDX6191729.1 T9SS type A sorting domain-containing protein [Flavobacterium sp. Fl-318]UFH41673.1 T9SS type A sorting domain-containing protein [Flavobacterium sp. F-323]